MKINLSFYFFGCLTLSLINHTLYASEKPKPVQIVEETTRILDQYNNLLSESTTGYKNALDQQSKAKAKTQQVLQSARALQQTLNSITL